MSFESRDENGVLEYVITAAESPTLAKDPQRLAALRQKLARNRDTHPLFDTARYTRDLEAIYRAIWERQQAGLPPETFSVAAIG